jgi:hypothetical protein
MGSPPQLLKVGMDIIHIKNSGVYPPQAGVFSISTLHFVAKS